MSPYLITGLLPETTFAIQIFPMNAAGVGPGSDIIKVTTKALECKPTEYLAGESCLPCVAGGVCDKSAAVYAQPGPLAPFVAPAAH